MFLLKINNYMFKDLLFSEEQTYHKMENWINKNLSELVKKLDFDLILFNCFNKLINHIAEVVK